MTKEEKADRRKKKMASNAAAPSTGAPVILDAERPPVAAASDSKPANAKVRVNRRRG